MFKKTFKKYIYNKYHKLFGYSKTETFLLKSRAMVFKNEEELMEYFKKSDVYKELLYRIR